MNWVMGVAGAAAVAWLLSRGMSLSRPVNWLALGVVVAGVVVFVVLAGIPPVRP